MEIGNSKNPEVRSDRLTSASKTGGAGTAASPPPADRSAGNGDRVTLTDAAQSLLKLHREAGADAPVDGGRVDAIRRALADGSYTVRPERIAEALIRQDNG